MSTVKKAPTIDPILLTATRLLTFEQEKPLTNASSFFFERDERLFLVTSRHVMIDEPNEHFPDRIEIELHTDADNLAESIGFSIPLYRNGKSVWRQGIDGAGEIDVAVIEIDRAALPKTVCYRAFTPAHLYTAIDHIDVGTSLLVVGFPLGFHDTLHHMPETHPKGPDLPWILLGVHSARIDAGSRDPEVDEALGLNTAWYADILLTLTE